ncbi:hypothetical protein PR202_gb12842 [Eleusine coracana subsp. coracana]|uniref:Uncharacterized protein n=1 Tax=Eleusine coracana subsp. coracana TaxID=191504 RepID=A0AAV5ERL0_ELECO|nr:hypothetical protein PR202_gb12842 [Eleusine coracana subsp. coracana]
MGGRARPRSESDDAIPPHSIASPQFRSRRLLKVALLHLAVLHRRASPATGRAEGVALCEGGRRQLQLRVWRIHLPPSHHHGVPLPVELPSATKLSSPTGQTVLCAWDCWLLLILGIARWQAAGMNTRPVVLVFLLLVLVITSQFEWKQQIGDAADADPAAARQRQQLLGRDDAVKEKVRAKSA